MQFWPRKVACGCVGTCTRAIVALEAGVRLRRNLQLRSRHLGSWRVAVSEPASAQLSPKKLFLGISMYFSAWGLGCIIGLFEKNSMLACFCVFKGLHPVL